MALNLAIHKATITDDGGTVTATQANMNGVHDEDESTNVVEVTTNNTLYLHYDLGAAYQITQLRIYASIINTAYWLVQCSNNDADWTTESLTTTGSYVYSNIDDGYRYLRIRCDTTGRSAISLREHEIDADATLMKYQTGSSDPIGDSVDTGTWFQHAGLNMLLAVDEANPAASDGYLVAMRWAGNVTGIIIFRLYILRSVSGGWIIVDFREWTGLNPNRAVTIIDPPLKFKAGDVIGTYNYQTSDKSLRRVASGGDSYWYRSYGWPGTPPEKGDVINKADFTEVADYELRCFSFSHTDTPGNGSDYIPVSDRFLTGLPGASTDPRVVNIDTNEGLNPELDFYSVVSSLATGIGSGDTSLTLHDASNFPQAAAGADCGGRLLIGTEKIDYTYISSSTIYGLTRGVDGSSPAGHSAWDIVKDITRWVEISVDDSTWKKPGDAGLPLSFGATIAVGASKTFYVRANVVYEYQDDKQIYSRVHVLWAV